MLLFFVSFNLFLDSFYFQISIEIFLQSIPFMQFFFTNENHNINFVVFVSYYYFTIISIIIMFFINY